MISNEEAMSLAIAQAKQGMGYVSPNPLVGAVILKGGKILSTGYHHKFGGIHAEIDAINNAGDIDFGDAILVVNLEPCSHHGKQPPCAEAIVKYGFKEVVIGMLDPNPLVAGRGVKILKDGGVKVAVGILEQECKWLNRVFIKHITSTMPYISLKNAQSINGAIATHSGNSKWISSVESRTIVHRLRAEYDAVAVGKNTVLLDNPELSVRLVNGRNPYRIVFDTNLDIPEHYKIFSDKEVQKTILISSSQYRGSEKAVRLHSKGISILFVRLDGNGRIDLKQAMQDLYTSFNIASVLVEGGSILFNSFLEYGLIDEYHIFIAPKIIPNGLTTFNGNYSIDEMSESNELELFKISKSGNDIHLLYVNSDFIPTGVKI